MHHGDSRSSNRMSFDCRSICYCMNLDAEFTCSAPEIISIGFANDERATVELASGSIKRLFRRFHLDVFQSITKRYECVVGVVIDQVDRASARYASRRTHVASHSRDRRLQHLCVGDAHNFNIPEFTHGPCGVIVNVRLWIVWRPILMIEQSIADAAVRLVHADDVAAGWESSIFSFRRGCW